MSKTKKVGFARLSKSERARMAAIGGKAAQKKARAGKKKGKK